MGVKTDENIEKMGWVTGAFNLETVAEEVGDEGGEAELIARGIPRKLGNSGLTRVEATEKGAIYDESDELGGIWDVGSKRERKQTSKSKGGEGLRRV